MKMTEYYSQRPGMYTGTANLIIPLHTINFEGWELPLTLSYNATGIRTNEEAGEVALGWSINATGVISRTIKGGDDLYLNPQGKRGYVHETRAVTHGLGYVFDPLQPFVLPDPNSYYAFVASNLPDTEPDIFNISFFGFNSSFVLSQKVSTGGVIKVVEIKKSALAISFNENTNVFTVLTPTGFKGEFSVLERSTSLASSIATADRMYCCAQNQIDIVQVKNNGQFRTITAWYLSKIVSPHGREITFMYDMNPDGSSPFISRSLAFAESDLGENETCLQTIHEHVYLKSINSHEVSIQFIMENREDLRKNDLFTPATPQVEFPNGNNLKRFKQITVTSPIAGSTLNKVITFVQNYFNQGRHKINSRTEDEFRYLRSRLARLTIDDQEYMFEYYGGSGGVPDKLTTGIDHFGFYNGVDNNTRVLPPTIVTYSGTCSMSDLAQDYFYQQRWERRVDFAYGMAGVLKKVRYPTRGYTIYEYDAHRYLPDQSNKFKEQPGVKLAGGARIKFVKEYDLNDNLVRQREYRYVESPGDLNQTETTSTGKLIVPLYNRYVQQLHDFYGQATNDCRFHYRSNSSIPGNNAAEGRILGYSKVHEIVTGSGSGYRNTYYYENRPSNVLAWNFIATGYPDLNGQLTEERNYNSLDKIVQMTRNADYEHNLGDIIGIVYVSQNTPGNQQATYIGYYTGYKILRTHHTPYRDTVITSQWPSEITENASGAITSFGRVHKAFKKRTYNADYLLKTEETTLSNSDILKTEFKRPTDYTAPSAVITQMRDPTTQNMVEPVIEEITTRNGIVIKASGREYGLQNGKVNLLKTYEYNPSLGAFAGSVNGTTFSSPYELGTQFTLYDPYGKPLEYLSNDGIRHSFVWGYNGTLPIVYGKGLDNASLNAAHNAAINQPDYNTALRNHTNTTGKQITTFTHNPQVGMASFTDASGNATNYQYDTNSRLKRVKDNQSNTANQYEYNFKQRQQTRILGVSQTSISFGNFYGCNMPEPVTLTLSNTGEDDLKVTYFLAPQGFTSSWDGGIICAGESVDVIIKFTAYYGGAYMGSIQMTTDMTSGFSGSISLHANWIIPGNLRTIQLSASSLVFENQFQTKYVTVTNTGNECLTITGVNYTAPDWSASISPIMLAPGLSTTLSIIRLGSNAVPGTIEVLSDKNGGVATMRVEKPTRILEVPPILFPSFTTVSNSQNLYVRNTGNSPLSVTNITSSNSRFSLSTTNFIVAPASEQVVTLTYTATDFSSQSTTLAFSTDATSGTGTTGTSAQRTLVRQISLSTALVYIKPSTPDGYVNITNTGNVDATISSINNSSPSNFHVEYWLSGAPMTLPLPRTLTPGQMLVVRVRTAGSYSTANGTLTVFNSAGAAQVINLARSTF